MNRNGSLRSLIGVAIACAASFTALTNLSLAQSPLQLPHVPSVVSNGQAAPLAPLPAPQQLNLSIVLPLRNETQL